MRKNIKHVLESFARGIPAVGDSKRTCWTDGTALYSYAMRIGVQDGGTVFLVPYSAGPSRTTRSQIRAAQQFFGAYGNLETAGVVR